MTVTRTRKGPVVGVNDQFFLLKDVDWDDLFRQDDLSAFLDRALSGDGRGAKALNCEPVERPEPDQLLPLIDSQEVWAAGVTYYRSRDARMLESKESGGDSFYDKIYRDPRPELFFKGNARTVVAHGHAVRIRRDSTWNVPEPELTLVVNYRGRVIGYTVGNDMSSRDIEGLNPLYLPQAKVYAGSCALGPAIVVQSTPPKPDTAITLEIIRGANPVFTGRTTLAELKRKPEELIEYLFRDNPFPCGVFLLTGTGIVPTDEFTLHPGDQVRIAIDGIGTLSNRVDMVEEGANK